MTKQNIFYVEAVCSYIFKISKTNLSTIQKQLFGGVLQKKFPKKFVKFREIHKKVCVSEFLF